MLTIRRPETYNWANIPLKECVEGNAMDSHFTLKLFNLFYDILEKQNRLVLMEEVLCPSISYLSEIERLGLNVDITELHNLELELNSDLEKMHDAILDLNLTVDNDGVETPINIKSTKDLNKLFYLEQGQFEIYPIKFSALTNAPSTDRESLEITLDLINEELIKRSNG